MKKLNQILLAAILCLTIISNGCGRHNELINSHTGSTPAGEATSSITETTTYNEPIPEPFWYEKIITGQPAVNSQGDVYFFEIPVLSSEQCDTSSFNRWNDGFLITVNNYSDGASEFIYYNAVNNKIEAKISCSYPMGVAYCDSKQLSFYDELTNSFYIYDSKLELIKKVPFPGEPLYGSVLISADGNNAYFSDSDFQTCYRFNLLDSTTSVVFTAPDSTTFYMSKLLFDDKMIEVSLVKEDAVYSSTVLVDIASGTISNEIGCYANISELKDGYGVTIYGNPEHIFLFNDDDSTKNREFMPRHSDEMSSHCIFPNKTILTYRSDNSDNPSVILRYYDIETGLCTNETTFPVEKDEYYSPITSNFIFLEDANIAVCLIDHKNPKLMLWNLGNENSKSDDTEIYTSKYYGPDENPEFFAKLLAYADEIGHRYNVTILIGDDIIKDLGDYKAETEFHTSIIKRALDTLDKALAKYPPNFFNQLKGENGKPLKISLTGSLIPYGYDTISNAVGLHNYYYGEQVILLNISDSYYIESTIYHEIFHAMDWIVIGKSSCFDNWYKLNPKDFSYDYGYVANSGNYDSKYVYFDDENSYFIDYYSKSYPNEDRARIFENAMCGNDYYFEREGLNNKLKTICESLRKVFDTGEWPEVTEWEKYIN